MHDSIFVAKYLLLKIKLQSKNSINDTALSVNRKPRFHGNGASFKLSNTNYFI